MLKGKRGNLVPGPQAACRAPEEAIRWAERAIAAGSVARRMSCACWPDEAAGEFNELDHTLPLSLDAAAAQLFGSLLGSWDVHDGANLPALLALARQPGAPAWPRGNSMKTMNDLFLHFLQDIYYAEKAFARSSGKIMKAVGNDEVREILRKAKENAHEPIEALDRVFEAVDKRPRGKACEAMNGLIAECQEAIEEGEKGPVLDAALIACLQGIKTYEITRYGSLLAFARQMGLNDAIGELEKLRDAARNDDQALSRIAEGRTNVEASASKGEDDEGKEPDEDEEPGEPDEKGKPKTVKKSTAKRQG